MEMNLVGLSRCSSFAHCLRRLATPTHSTHFVRTWSLEPLLATIPAAQSPRPDRQFPLAATVATPPTTQLLLPVPWSENLPWSNPPEPGRRSGRLHKHTQENYFARQP